MVLPGMEAVPAPRSRGGGSQPVRPTVEPSDGIDRLTVHGRVVRGASSDASRRRTLTDVGAMQRNRREALRIQTRAPDEPTIHIGLTEEIGRVVRFHAAAVEDVDIRCDLVADQPSELFPDQGVHFVGLLRGCGVSGANRPHGFVGDDQIWCGLDVNPRQTAIELRAYNGFRISGVSF